MRFGLKRDDEVWDWWKHGWRNEHKLKPNENYGRDKTEVWEVELFNLPMVLLKVVQEPVVVPQIQYIGVCWKDKFSQFREFRNCGRSAKRKTTIGWSMSLSWCISFFPPFKKRRSLSPSESFVKSQIACLVRIVLCELRLGC